MIPLERVKKIIDTYENLEKELASGKVDTKDFVKKSKEYSNIGEIIKEAKGYINFEKEKIELDKIKPNNIFKWLHKQGINDKEMLKTFNCGLGLIMTISKNNYKEFEQLIKDENLDIFEIGKIEVNKSSRCTIS